MKRRSFLSIMLACTAYGFSITAGAVNAMVRDSRARLGMISFYPYFGNRRSRTSSVEKITLAKDRIAQYVIAIPEPCPSVVLFAAQELKEHLFAITKAEFQIVNVIPEGKNSIILGSHSLSRALDADVSTLIRDGYIIKAMDRNIFIRGQDDAAGAGDILFSLKEQPLDHEYSGIRFSEIYGADKWDFPRGTLYGVYRFLEELGVRWFFAGDKGTEIPRVDDLTIDAFSLLEEPACAERVAGRARHRITGRESSESGFSPKTGLEMSPKAVLLWMCRVRAGSVTYAKNHRPHRVRFEDRFGKSRPEYFAMRKDGKRSLKENAKRKKKWAHGHLDYLVRGVFEEYLKDIDAYLRGRPAKERGANRRDYFLGNNGWNPQASYKNTISLTPNDGYRGAFNRASRMLMRWGDKSATNSEIIWPFVAKVASHFQGRYPEVLFVCLAYKSYSRPPRSLKRLPGNVVVVLAPAHKSCDLIDVHALCDPEKFREFEGLLESWDAVVQQPLSFWLHQLYRSKMRSRSRSARVGWRIPMIYPHHLDRLVKTCSRHGRNFFFQIDDDNVVYEHLNRYCLYKVMEDPDLDIDELIDDYVIRFYGPASEIMKQLLVDIEQTCIALASQGCKWDPRPAWEDYFTMEKLATYRKKSDEALRVTVGTKYHGRVGLISDHLLGRMERESKAYRAAM